jgi:hypothetical protein
VTALPKGIAAAAPTVPTIRREFAARAPLSAYVEVYDNAKGTARRDVELRLEVRNQSGHVAQTGGARLPSRGGILPFTIPVPLDVPPGRYVLHFAASTGTAKTTPVTHDIPIRVS